VVLLDQREREVHPGRHARRGGDVPVADEDGIVLDGHARMPARKLVARRPVGRCATAVEQAGGGEQEGPGAHGADAPRARGGAADPRDQGVVFERTRHACAPDDDECVERAARRGERPVGEDRQATRAADRIARPGDDPGGIGLAAARARRARRPRWARRDRAPASRRRRRRRSGGRAWGHRRVPSSRRQGPMADDFCHLTPGGLQPAPRPTRARRTRLRRGSSPCRARTRAQEALPRGRPPPTARRCGRRAARSRPYARSR
jgi:hypothetical protein